MLRLIGAGARVGDQTFLYDAMTLVRCAAPGDWSQVLKQADREVSELVQQRQLLNG